MAPRPPKMAPKWRSKGVRKTVEKVIPKEDMRISILHTIYYTSRTSDTPQNHQCELVQNRSKNGLPKKTPQQVTTNGTIRLFENESHGIVNTPRCPIQSYHLLHTHTPVWVTFTLVGHNLGNHHIKVDLKEESALFPTQWGSWRELSTWSPLQGRQQLRKL